VCSAISAERKQALGLGFSALGREDSVVTGHWRHDARLLHCVRNDALGERGWWKKREERQPGAFVYTSLAAGRFIALRLRRYRLLADSRSSR